MSDKALILIVVAILILQVLATTIIWRSPAVSSERRISQTFVVWLLPVLGAIVALTFIYFIKHEERIISNRLEQRRESGAAFESGDNIGADGGGD